MELPIAIAKNIINQLRLTAMLNTTSENVLPKMKIDNEQDFDMLRLVVSKLFPNLKDTILGSRKEKCVDKEDIIESDIIVSFNDLQHIETCLDEVLNKTSNSPKIEDCGEIKQQVDGQKCVSQQQTTTFENSEAKNTINNTSSTSQPFSFSLQLPSTTSSLTSKVETAKESKSSYPPMSSKSPTPLFGFSTASSSSPSVKSYFYQ